MPSTSTCSAWMVLANARPAAWFLALTVSVGAPTRVQSSPRRSTDVNADAGGIEIRVLTRAVISLTATSQP